MKRSPMPRPAKPLRRFKPLLAKKKLARTPRVSSGTSGVEESTGRDGGEGWPFLPWTPDTCRRE